MTYIAVDWGSSSFRAFLVDAQGNVVDRTRSDRGVLNIVNGAYGDILVQNCGAWMEKHPQVPVIMAGMIGSRNGWRESPYVPCPTSADSLADQLTPVRSATISNSIYIVPGLSGQSPSGANDVMRGEETQIFGALHIAGQDDAILCVPGTHSKWATVTQGKIENFSTFFTGELYSLLLKHSSIGKVIADSTFDPDAFLRGVRYSHKPGGLNHHIFSVRAGLLTREFSEAGLAAFLSGIIIGHELKDARAMYWPLTPNSAPNPAPRNDNPVLLIADAKLQPLYTQAGEVYGIRFSIIDPEATVVDGLVAIATRRSLIQDTAR